MAIAREARLQNPLAPAGRVGIIGVGAFGRFCLQTYARLPDVTVCGVADASQDAIQHPDVVGVGAPMHTDYRRLLDDSRIEVIHIATPPAQHAELILAGVGAGKSVFCEKPLALTSADADNVIAACHERGRALVVNYVLRHHPLYQLLLRASMEGVAGKPRRIALDNAAGLVSPDHWLWKPQGGGILVEHGVHFFDVFMHLAGPARVRSTMSAPPRVVTHLEHASGAWSTFYHDFSYEYRIEHLDVRILFERGQACLEGWIPTRLCLRLDAVDGRPWIESVRHRLGEDPGMHTYTNDGEIVTLEVRIPDREAAYRQAIACGLRDAVRAHRNPDYMPLVSPEDARTSLALALAATACSGAESIPWDHRSLTPMEPS